PLTDLPGRALRRVVGAVAAYNLLVLATFPLAAAAAYLLARYVVGSHLGAMVAGLVYAFLPFHLAQATQHPHVAQTQWLPLYFLALWRCLDRPDLRRALLLLAATAAVTLSNFYGALIAAVLTPVALCVYAVVRPQRPTGDPWRGLALTAITLAAAGALGLLVVHGLAPEVLSRPAAFAVPRRDLFLHSAKWWSYLVPAVDHPLAGSWVRELWAARGLEGVLLEQQVGVGWSVLALGAVPLWLWLRGDRSSLAVRSAPLLAIVALGALVCSLSPERRLGPFNFVRPSAWLYEAAPMFRAYARFGVVVGLMTALLAGAGAASLWRKTSSAGRRAAAVLLGLAVLEMAPWPPWRWRDVLPTRAHRWLAAQPGPLRVLDCAPARLSDSLALSRLGHQATLLGAPGFDDCGEPRLGEKLRAMGYTHLVVRRDGAVEDWLAKEPPAGLSSGPVFEDARIFQVTAEPPVAYVSALPGFHPREYGGGATWRWMGPLGALRIATAREVTGTTLVLELRSFPGDRLVTWTQDGRDRGRLHVTREWRWHELTLQTLAPGETTLTFDYGAPVVANRVLENGDPRALGLALGRFGMAIGPEAREQRSVVKDDR
ncbi:MAG TPA: 6-pyruvoyl-tetrahydropterin synthase-related protein, partial [Vicinamibacteria bacterium]